VLWSFRVLLLRDVPEARLQQLQVVRGIRVAPCKRPGLALARLLLPGRCLRLLCQAAQLGQGPRDAHRDVEGVGVLEVVLGDGQLAGEVGGQRFFLGELLGSPVRGVRLRPEEQYAEWEKLQKAGNSGCRIEQGMQRSARVLRCNWIAGGCAQRKFFSSGLKIKLVRTQEQSRKANASRDTVNTPPPSKPKST
jgi:hypothetical protein